MSWQKVKIGWKMQIWPLALNTVGDFAGVDMHYAYWAKKIVVDRDWRPPTLWTNGQIMQIRKLWIQFFFQDQEVGAQIWPQMQIRPLSIFSYFSISQVSVRAMRLTTMVTNHLWRESIFVRDTSWINIYPHSLTFNDI